MRMTAWARHAFRCGMVIAPCVLAMGCVSREEAAFRSASEAWSCPREELSVTPIDNVTMGELELQALPPSVPPSEVQADPARLAIWNKAQEKARRSVLFHAKDFALFHVDGCGHAVDYACYCPPVGNSSHGPWQEQCHCEDPPSPIPR